LIEALRAAAEARQAAGRALLPLLHRAENRVKATREAGGKAMGRLWGECEAAAAAREAELEQRWAAVGPAQRQAKRLVERAEGVLAAWEELDGARARCVWCLVFAYVLVVCLYPL